MPFEGEKFEETPTPPEEEAEERGEEIEEKEKSPLEQAEEIAEIYQEYWRIEREALKKSKEFQELLDEEREEKYNELIDELRRMREPIKEMVRDFKQVDEEAVRNILGELDCRRFECMGRIEAYKSALWITKTESDIKILKESIKGEEEKKKRIEDILEAYEKGDTTLLKNYIEKELHKELIFNWEGERGAEDLRKALLLKTALNTLERK
jgi:hypothetical protein